MALLESVLIPLGTQMPDFELKDPSGKIYKGNELYDSEKGRGLLIAFTCNHCPYAIAVWPRLIRLAEYAKGMRINTIAINPNIHPDYPEDSAENMKAKIKELNISFPYLVDESQEVARGFKAQCTPDIYLFDNHKKLIYHGRIDDNWKDEASVTKQELKEALNDHASGKGVSKEQKPSMGCSIKWRA
ncbi:MAG: thioredoxin family protein [Candidatus Omnitrophica bacterium]|nr:thioredoxin family protein [Candidatus Omnitrophota bacterium]